MALKHQWFKVNLEAGYNSEGDRKDIGENSNQTKFRIWWKDVLKTGDVISVVNVALNTKLGFCDDAFGIEKLLITFIKMVYYFIM